MAETKEDITTRLHRLETFLDEEGWYVHANTAYWARIEIERLRAECTFWQNAAMRADERTEEAYASRG